MTREQVNAYAKFKALYETTDIEQFKSNAQEIKKDAPLLRSGFFAYSNVPFQKTNIPHEQHWAWNQSNAKISVPLHDDKVLTFRKISPRKRYNDNPAPYFKVWLYQVQNPDSTDDYLLWCEKGDDLPSTGVKTEIGFIFPEQLTTASLSFLKPFVDTETAIELGWS